MTPPLPDVTALPRVAEVDVHHKAVLVRVDLNIPAPSLRDVGVAAEVADDWRIEVILPCVRGLLARGARVVLLTHRGRPPGVPVPALSTKPLVSLLHQRLGCPVHHVDDCVGAMVEERIKNLAPGEVLLLENVRFHAGETRNDVTFVQQLVRLAEVVVLEAFASLHRAHASLSGLMAVAPVVAVGPRLELELGWLRQLLHGTGPLTVMLGGVHIGLKIDLLYALLDKADTLMVGGGAAHTLLAAREVPTGLVHFEPALMNDVRALLAEAGVRGCRLLLPQDLHVASRDNPAQPLPPRAPGKLATTEMAMDIGPKTLETWQHVLTQKNGRVLWLGSLGAWEYPAFRNSTVAIAQTLSAMQDRALVGGDGLLQALRLTKMRTQLRCVSSGAAVMMHALRGLPMPALEILGKRQHQPWVGERRKIDTRN